MSTRRLVGIDVGGTAIKAGAIDPESGAILGEAVRPIPQDFSSEQLLRCLVELARELDIEEHIGVGAPGLLDREHGRIVVSPNLRALDMLPLCEGLDRELGLPTGTARLGNDADMAALGESWQGAGKDEQNFLMVTLGTGIGGGLILDGEVYVGAGLAGEIGHVTVDPDGPLCGCGRLGCLETLSSATAAIRRSKERGLPREAPGDLVLLSEAARAAAGPEREVLHAVGCDLGRGLGAAVCLLDLRTFVFSGGFAGALDVLEPGIRSGFAESTYGERVAEIRLLRASLGNKAGWIGAARLAMS